MKKDAEREKYIITTELDEALRNNVYILTDEEEIGIFSMMDDKFLKSYTLPEGFEVEEEEHSFEGKYLIIKLTLKKI